jgi:hypothetical protein
MKTNLQTSSGNLIKIRKDYLKAKAFHNEALDSYNEDKRVLALDDLTDEEFTLRINSDKFAKTEEQLQKDYGVNTFRREIERLEDLIFNVGIKFFEKINFKDIAVIKNTKNALHRQKFINLTLRSPIFN